MKRFGFLFIAIMLIAIVHVQAQTTADSAAIKRTAQDYVEGWYEGNAERMQRALHPELAKRIVLTDEQTGKNWLDSMGATKLVQGTRRGGGNKTPKEQQQKDVYILDIFENAASGKSSMCCGSTSRSKSELGMIGLLKKIITAFCQSKEAI